VVGHSFGGGPVLELALRHPDRLWGLALLDVALALEEPDSVDRIDQLLEVKRVREWMVAATFTNPRATQTVLEQFIADPADATPDRVELYQRPLDIDGTTEAIADWLPELWSPDRDVWSFDEGRFDRIDVPVAVLWGTADTVTPLEQGEHLVKAMPRARLHRLEGLGHIPHIEDPEAVHAVLVPYLQHAHAIWQRKAGPIR
jgi:pimeloyl-ACP methyl ester carboxylesterase